MNRLTTANPPRALHEQIYSDLETQIRTSQLKAGEQLPSESELQKQYNVSRSPIRQALDKLEAAGMIYRAQGRGSFVREARLGGFIGYMQGVTQELAKSHHEVETVTLAIELIMAEQTVVRELDLEPDAKVLHIQRLMVVDGIPLMLIHNYLRPVISIDFLRREGNFSSLSALLQREGIETHEAGQTLSATILDKESATLLQAPSVSAVLLIKQRYYSATTVPVLFSTFLIRTDRYEFEIGVNAALNGGLRNLA